MSLLKTPPTLREAIVDALRDRGANPDLTQTVLMHVLDRLAQDFAVARLEAADSPEADAALERLWSRIFADCRASGAGEGVSHE